MDTPHPFIDPPQAVSSTSVPYLAPCRYPSGSRMPGRCMQWRASSTRRDWSSGLLPLMCALRAQLQAPPPDPPRRALLLCIFRFGRFPRGENAEKVLTSDGINDQWAELSLFRQRKLRHPKNTPPTAWEHFLQAQVRVGVAD